MSIISLLVLLVIVGLCLYLVERFIPMSEPVRIIIRVVVVLLLILLLLQTFGIFDSGLRIK